MADFDSGPLEVIPNLMPKNNKKLKTVLDSVFILSGYLIKKYKTQHCDKNNKQKHCIIGFVLTYCSRIHSILESKEVVVIGD